MSRTNHYTPDAIIAALRATRGLVNLAAQRLDCTPQTVRRYVRQYPAIKEALDEIREEAVDLAEAKLWSAVSDGNITAIIFALKTLGKSRGYTERHELTGKDGKDLPSLVEIDPSKLTDDQIRALLAARIAAADSVLENEDQ